MRHGNSKRILWVLVINRIGPAEKRKGKRPGGKSSFESSPAAWGAFIGRVRVFGFYLT
jgi:hypothetical protein